MSGGTYSRSGAESLPADLAAQQESRYGVPLLTLFGQTVLFPSAAEYFAVISAIKADGFETVSDLTAVDYLSYYEQDGSVCTLPNSIAPERFEVVVNLLSLSKRERIRVRVQVSGEQPTLPTLFDLYPGTEAMEREVFDLFGIVFEGHPDLTRILMPEDWEGHPLRKDYAQGIVPVQFKAPPSSR